MLNVAYPLTRLGNEEGRRDRDKGVAVWVTDCVVFEGGRDVGMFVR